MFNKYKVIDFHTHPFLTKDTNICSHVDFANMSAENTIKDLKGMGMDMICGSVVKNSGANTTWETIKALNDEALVLRDMYKGFYIPGFHVHPKYLKESIAEIERMNKAGVKLIGELVTYMHAWQTDEYKYTYDSKEFHEILECADHYKMIVNFHPYGYYAEFPELQEQMDNMVRKHKNIVFVAAHPSEGKQFLHHMKRMEISDNYYCDLSGGGIFRHGTLRHGIDLFGKERFLFGSDYPTCNPAMFLGGVALDFLISEEEKEYVFHKNAECLLGLEN